MNAKFKFSICLNVTINVYTCRTTDKDKLQQVNSDDLKGQERSTPYNEIVFLFQNL